MPQARLTPSRGRRRATQCIRATRGASSPSAEFAKCEFAEWALSQRCARPSRRLVPRLVLCAPESPHSLPASARAVWIHETTVRHLGRPYSLECRPSFPRSSSPSRPVRVVTIRCGPLRSVTLAAYAPSQCSSRAARLGRASKRRAPGNPFVPSSCRARTSVPTAI